MRKRTPLPRTSRVNEKIIEYYMKFGQERDLEKYMRLYSPTEQRSECRSHSSATTISSCQSEDEGRVLRRLFQQETEVTTESDTDATEFIVPIERQKDKMSKNVKKPKGDECTSSAPDLHTPPSKSQKATDTKQTQTPESIAKSHRRLEWDSLGDVGYRKSLSTSNISILERSVLKEYFQEFTATSSTRKEHDAVDSKTSKLTKKSELKETHMSKKLPKEPPAVNNTPPLASSTMMDKESEKENIPTGSRPKLISRSTSMSLHKRYDQYAQTSIQRMPQLTSREVQVALSSGTSVSSSNAAGTATPSSFDYYSSRSTNSTTDGELGVKKLPPAKLNTKLSKSSQEPNQVHPFVAGLNKMLESHKAIESTKRDSIKNDTTTSVQQVHDTLQKILNDNKENSTSTSTMLNSPQLDLGIQLLCSLIDASSLSQRQKKKLVRDIVKRITTLNTEDVGDAGGSNLEPCDDNVSTPQSSTRPTYRVEQQTVETSLKSTSTVKVARTAKTSMDMSDLPRDLRSSNSSSSVEQLMQVDVFKRPSLPTTSAEAAVKLAGEKAKRLQNLTTKQTQAETLEKSEDESKLKNNANENILKQTENLDNPVIEQVKLNNNTDKDSSASKASTTSKEVTTQKAVVNIETAATSDTVSDIAAHSTMRDWLNPMTQSEIEYEEKKREFERSADKIDKIKTCIDNENFDTERKTQLKWIQAEIQRLETLRCLLLKTNVERANDVHAKHKIDTDLDMHEIENLYDTVFTETNRESIKTATTTSSAHSSCGHDGKPVQEIEVIIEESNEDVVKLDERITRSKQRKRETQIVYDKPNDVGNAYDNLAAGRARFRTMTEIVTTNEEQILPFETAASSSTHSPPLPVPTPEQLPTDTQRQQQRSKMDTPSADSNDGVESVGSFAKQRKREFLEQYRNKKRIHYESLLHQQQQLLIQQQQHIIQELQQRCNSITHQNNARQTHEHYSLPLNIPNGGFCGCGAHQQQEPYQQSYLVGQGPPMQPHARPYAPCPPHRPSTSRLPQTQKVAATINCAQHKTETIHSEQSTSSIFCISSEVSIPIGSTSTTSSTTTTTHQYDDVAAVFRSTTKAGVGVQTGASLQRTQPIFGRRLVYDCAQGRNVPNYAIYNPQPIHSGQSISVQVKPKSIAYVIQFDKKTTTSTTTISTTTTSTASNSSLSKIDNGADEMRDEPKEPCALQDYLERAKPQFVAHTKERKAILNEIQALRLERGKELRDIIENASENSLDTRLQRLPPPATKRLRIFATKEMKAITQRHFKNLPEVVKQQERAREERHRLGNRMIRDIFNQRLQRRVRTGKLSLNHSKTVI